MTDAEQVARATVVDLVPRETIALLDRFVGLLIEAASRTNLVSAATLPTIWQRHILDSAQLAALDDGGDTWLDIGSGAGLPGLVIAILTGRAVTLAEPRQLRVSFLEDCIAELGMTDRVHVHPRRIQTLRSPPFGVVSARAVATVSDLFAMAAHVSDQTTRWILPKGRNAAADVADAARLWHADVVNHPSVTDSEASIVIATGVRAKAAR